MRPTDHNTRSEGRVGWDESRLRFPVGREYVYSIGSGRLTASIRYPSLESLTRRFEASDQCWLQRWLNEDDDPCLPE
jgi:hypothetical protein